MERIQVGKTFTRFIHDKDKKSKRKNNKDKCYRTGEKAKSLYQLKKL